MADGPDSVQPASTATGLSKRARWLIVGVAAVGAVLYGAYAIHQETENFAAGDRADAGLPIAKAPVSKVPVDGTKSTDNRVLTKSDLQAMSPDQVKYVDPRALLAAYGPDFDQWRQETYELALRDANLTSEQKSVLSVPVGSKEAYSDQDVINQVTLDLLDASIQDDTVTGERMLSLVHSPQLAEYSDDLKTIDKSKTNTTKTSIVNINRQVAPALPRPTGSFNGVGLSDYAQARLVEREFIPGPDNPSGRYTEYALYGLVKNGQLENWQLLRRWLLSDNQVFYALRDLTASQSSH